MGLVHEAVQIWILLGWFEVDGDGGVGYLVDGSWYVLELDPDVPVVQICPQSGSAIKGEMCLGKYVA